MAYKSKCLLHISRTFSDRATVIKLSKSGEWINALKLSEFHFPSQKFSSEFWVFSDSSRYVHENGEMRKRTPPEFHPQYRAANHVPILYCNNIVPFYCLVLSYLFCWQWIMSSVAEVSHPNRFRNLETPETHCKISITDLWNSLASVKEMKWAKLRCDRWLPICFPLASLVKETWNWTFTCCIDACRQNFW